MHFFCPATLEQISQITRLLRNRTKSLALLIANARSIFRYLATAGCYELAMIWEFNFK